MLNHIVAKLRERVKCYCGGLCIKSLSALSHRTLHAQRRTAQLTMRPPTPGDMAPDEFNRKYHPLPALINLLSNAPITSEVKHATPNLARNARTGTHKPRAHRLRLDNRGPRGDAMN